MPSEEKKMPGTDFGANRKITGTGYDETMAVTCQNGVFVGRREEGVNVWRGIPFAKPPIGSLRFMPPVKPDDSNDVFEAYHYGFKAISYTVNTDFKSEDCLTLNIFTNSRKTGKKAVMVWIHGGAFQFGSPSDPYFFCDDLAKAHPDIVFVTISYRLSVFGFLDFDDVEGAPKGMANNGFRDMICALKWVRENIAGFGGDPENVTVAGESAGGIATVLLCVCEKAGGLFRKAVIQSGPAGAALEPGYTKPAAKALCEATGAKTFSDLQRLALPDILKTDHDVLPKAAFLGPVKDGNLIPADPLLAIQEGKASHIKILIGYNAHECRCFLPDFWAAHREKTDDVYLGWTTSRFGELKKSMTPEDAALADTFIRDTGLKEPYATELLATEICFGAETRLNAASAAKHGDTYLYFYAFPTYGDYFGAAHFTGVEPLFGKDFSKAKRSGDYSSICRYLQEVWTNFIRTGVPTIDGKPVRTYDNANRSYIVFDATGKAYERNTPPVRNEEIPKKLLRYQLECIRVNFAPEPEVCRKFGLFQ